jgi:hypothetical protein
MVETPVVVDSAAIAKGLHVPLQRQGIELWRLEPVGKHG